MVPALGGQVVSAWLLESLADCAFRQSGELIHCITVKNSVSVMIECGYNCNRMSRYVRVIIEYIQDIKRIRTTTMSIYFPSSKTDISKISRVDSISHSIQSSFC